MYYIFNLTKKKQLCVVVKANELQEAEEILSDWEDERHDEIWNHPDVFCYTDMNLENILLSKELFQKWIQKQPDGGYQYLIETDNEDAKDEFVKTDNDDVKDEFIKTAEDFKEAILKLTVTIHNCSEQLRRNHCDRACGSGDSV